MTAYYNEFDPKAAAWLRELIGAGHIAPGDVDERSIVDIRPSDLIGYTQCHFFAGIGVWSHALRRAGWPDDRPVWTGSCPCQPFSAAGKGAGFTDERHLWPHFHWLIENCRPPVVFGEQVASKDGLGWLDLVQADLEGSGYASGAVDTCAAGFGAPHIRQRLYWVAHSNNKGPQGRRGVPKRAAELAAGACGLADGLADPTSIGRLGRRSSCESHEPGEIERSERLRDVGGMADTRREQREWRQGAAQGRQHDGQDAGRLESHHGPIGIDETRHGPQSTGPTNGFWRDADWLFCRDGKWRPVEPGTFPLAHGAAARVGRLRGYGNAINAEQAQAFIEAYLESELAAVHAPTAANDNTSKEMAA
ncbi:DNA cytosine methyltransferase [Brucella intermedia]|uniref:DNA cytosine methyltransferase n=1 Tax=Brucella intermedia TaxID=94625 RepID=UPI00165CF425|nr:DNA cytosine methyltransferase [Brucella intermedia]QNQ43033.1 DNA cytosine methyltransferase [Brucella intermedia]